MFELTKDLDLKGKTVTFTETMTDENYMPYDGKEFRVLEVFLDHETCLEEGGFDPICLPLIKIELISDPKVVFNAYSDEVGDHSVIKIFCDGIQAAHPLYNSYNNLPGSEGFDISKVKSLKDYEDESKKLNPYSEGTCEYTVFKKGFEVMYYK